MHLGTTVPVMLNTSIHDSTVARLAAQAQRSHAYEQVLAAGDDFVAAAAHYLAAEATHSADAAGALVEAGKAYGAIIAANNGTFDVTTDTGFANVAKVVKDVKASTPSMPRKWEEMVDCYTANSMDAIHHIRVVVV